MKKINIVLIIMFFGLTFSCKAQERQSNIATEIIGTWIGEDDTEVKLVFSTDGTYFEYYDNQPTGNYDYLIIDKCGDEEDSKSWFLKTVDKEDNAERCYELYGANVDNNNTLSMRDMKTGKVFVYNKN